MTVNGIGDYGKKMMRGAWGGHGWNLTIEDMQ